MRVVLLAMILFVCGGPQASAAPYTLPNTEVLRIHSKQTGASYELFVATPPGYRKSGHSYPVVYLLDADYSFALVRNVVQHFIERDNLPPLILVAVAYPGAASNRETYRKNRTRDYTPVYAPDGGYGAEYQKVSGGGAKFRAFFAKELIPLIDRKFPTVPGDRTIIGHSYGGLFASFVLVTQSELFSRYIIVSPSLWYANRSTLSMADAAVAGGSNIRARAFFGVGEFENQPQNNRAMVDDLKEFVATLRSRQAPQLKLSMKIFEGETHNSVFPGAVTRGLLTIFDPPAVVPSAQPAGATPTTTP
jgi:predicted alpha/beta superfamily hydrolase